MDSHPSAHPQWPPFEVCCLIVIFYYFYNKEFTLPHWFPYISSKHAHTTYQQTKTHKHIKIQTHTIPTNHHSISTHHPKKLMTLCLAFTTWTIITTHQAHSSPPQAIHSTINQTHNITTRLDPPIPTIHHMLHAHNKATCPYPTIHTSPPNAPTSTFYIIIRTIFTYIQHRSPPSIHTTTQLENIPYNTNTHIIVNIQEDIIKHRRSSTSAHNSPPSIHRNMDNTQSYNTYYHEHNNQHNNQYKRTPPHIFINTITYIGSIYYITHTHHKTPKPKNIQYYT